MRKLGMRAIALALAVGLTGAVGLAADDEIVDAPAKKQPEHQAGWTGPFKKLFEPDPKKVAAKKTAAKSEAKPTKAATVVNEAAAVRAREEAEFVRRLQVCDKLMEIAVQKNDQELIRRVELLDEQARATYAQRTAALQSSGFDSDERTLQKQLDPSGAPSKIQAELKSGSGKDRASRVAAKEVKP